MLSNAIALIAVAAMFGIEANKASERVPRIVLTVIAVLFVLSAATIQPIADASPKVGAFITGIFAQPVSWFILAMALFFVARPMWSKRARLPFAELNDQESTEADMLDSKVEMMGKLTLEGSQQHSEMHRLLGVKIDQLDERFSQSVLNFGTRLTALEDAKPLAEKAIKQNEEGLAAALALLGQHQTFALNELKELREALELIRHDARLADEQRRTDNTRTLESIYAIYSREILAKLALDIEREASELYDAFVAGETYDAERWKLWEATYARWESALRTWVDNGRWYAYDVPGRVWTVDDAKYEGNWSVEDDQFPGSIAVHKFKKFRIIHTQWQDVKEGVDRGAVQVAFVGMTAAEMQRKP